MPTASENLVCVCVYYFSILCFIFSLYSCCKQPQVFQKMRHDLASMWKPSGKVGNPRRILAKAGFHCCHEKKSFSDYEESMAVDVSMKDMKVGKCNHFGSLLLCMFFFYLCQS